MTTEPAAALTVDEACAVRVVGLDFDTRTECGLQLCDVAAAAARGMFVWIDVAFSSPQAARALLAPLGLIDGEALDDALTREAATQLARYEHYLHLSVAGCRLGPAGLALERIDCAIGSGFLLTLHRGQPGVIAAMQQRYHEDFARFAKTPSFLVYELWDQLASAYLGVQRGLEQRVEALQRRLMSEIDDDSDVFQRVAELGADLLCFRNVLLPARAVLSDLGTRRTLFLSETTQQFLNNLVGTVDHVLQDLMVDRDILSDSLNLHMSIATHRTNQVMKRLTVVSVIFLPLTFLCGVYGMNFQYLPELAWRHGYALFWLAALGIVATIAWLSRRARLL